MSDMNWLGVKEAAKLVASKELSPVELTKELLARIELYDPGLNSFLTLRPDVALADARIAEDAVMNGAILSPLHGVPFALKDIIDAKGWPTTAHSRLLSKNIATEDAIFNDLLFFSIGILSLFFISLCIFSGTPALSRPNKIVSPFLNLKE